jgi:hypothetical protein
MPRWHGLVTYLDRKLIKTVLGLTILVTLGFTVQAKEIYCVGLLENHDENQAQDVNFPRIMGREPECKFNPSAVEKIIKVCGDGPCLVIGKSHRVTDSGIEIGALKSIRRTPK